jgi:hypothetical protein
MRHVCLSVRLTVRTDQRGSHCTEFRRISYWRLVKKKNCRETPNLVKMGKAARLCHFLCLVSKCPPQQLFCDQIPYNYFSTRTRHHFRRLKEAPETKLEALEGVRMNTDTNVTPKIQRKGTVKMEAQSSSDTLAPSVTLHNITTRYESDFKFKVNYSEFLSALNLSHIYLETCIANNAATGT